jgi:IclR family KDG regulon transcriptional repressor
MQAPMDDETIAAVDRAIDVIGVLRDRDGAGVTEIANELGWAKSTVHTHLRTLWENEYVVRENDQYVLSLRFLDLGEYVKTRKPVYSVVEPRIEELADETGKRVQFITYEHGYGVYARIAKGEHAVSTGGRLGRRRSMLHSSAAGKSILASLPREEVEEIFDRRGLPRSTENTITDRDEMFRELATVRDNGFAFNHEEHIHGLRAAAAPVHGPENDVLGAVSVAGTARRMRDSWFTDELPELILGVTNEVELELTYP